jgi:O-antigen ligase
LLNLFHIVLGDKGRWQVLAYACLCAMLGLILLSGSRSSALMMVAGLAVTLPALGRRRRQTFILVSFSLLVLSGLAVFWLSSGVDAEGLDPNTDEQELRILGELTKDTRLKIWTSHVALSLREPIIGIGWHHRSNRWSTVQSAYLQVFLEAGILGAIPLLLFIVTALFRIVRMVGLAKKRKSLQSSLALVFAATLFALLFHSAFESSAVTGASPIAVLIGFCTGQVDQYLSMAKPSGVTPKC